MRFFKNAIERVRAMPGVESAALVRAVRSLESQVEATQGSTRFLAALLGIFAGVALLLAGMGIYGVTSYGVAQQTHEIGIRLALGASGDRVRREVVGRGARLTLIAVSIAACYLPARRASRVDPVVALAQE